MLTGSFCFQITKKHVDNYQPRRRIPHCELSARMATSKTDLAPLHYRVKMIGAKEPYNRFTIVMDHSSLSQTSSVKRLMRRASGTSLIHLLPPLDETMYILLIIFLEMYANTNQMLTTVMSTAPLNWVSGTSLFLLSKSLPLRYIGGIICFFLLITA